MTFIGSFSIFLNAFKTGFSLSIGWLVVAGLCILLGGIGLIFYPEYSGYVCGSVFIVLYVVPLIAIRYLNRLMNQSNYDRACLVIRFIALLHPADGISEQVRIIDAIRSAKGGDFCAAKKLLEKHISIEHPTSCIGVIQLLRVQNKWEDILELCEKEKVKQIREKVPVIMVYYLRALFEIGNLHEAIQYYLYLKKNLTPRMYSVFQYLGSDIFLFAFTGRIHSLQKLLIKMKISGTPMYQFWMATAQFVSGNGSPIEEFKKLADTEDTMLHNAVEKRLEKPPEQNPKLTDEENNLLDELESNLDQIKKYGHQSADIKKSFITLGIAGIIVIMFTLELVTGGAQNLRNLWRLGALDPYKVLDGQYWRLISSIFLHYGWPHVILNLIALIYFGPFVESNLGRIHYAICYFFSGIDSMFLLALFVHFEWIRPMIVIGASGSIMGIIGATGAILFRGWKVDTAKIAQRRLVGIGIILTLQIIYDLITPQVSFTAHITGVGIGLLITLIFQTNEGNKKANGQIKEEKN